MRSAYKVRVYSDSAQAVQSGSTFGCGRLMWNKTLAARHTAWHRRGQQLPTPRPLRR
ncbi:helix-turn-helix domain-containing protein [Salinactinospora qingdaonensis]|uniref:helix-turn-helix domain-containing protein n=1 Tax=Salinactinospora qingdaonensis TaxID=702744 RepID=UPI0031ECC512